MPQDGLSPEHYVSYIEEYRPEVGPVGSPGFFYNLLSQYLPDRRWPNAPTENPAVRRVMGAGWMYDAGIVIAQEEGRIDDLLNAVRLSEPLDEQAYALLTIADEEKMPELLEEALDRWEEFVDAGEHEEDFDPSYTYEYICMLAAKFKKPELFEKVLGRIPDKHHPGVLTEASQYGDESYITRATKQLVSLEHDNEADDYHVAINVLERALKTHNYVAAVRAIATSIDIFYEPEFFDDVVGVAVKNDELAKLRGAVSENALGLHLYELSIRMAMAGDKDSAYMAAESLTVLPREEGADGDEVLYGLTRRVIESIKDLEPKLQEEIKTKVKDFLDGVFNEARSSGDLMTAFNAALGYFKVGGSLERIDTVLAKDQEETVEKIADALTVQGYWGVFGPTSLIISLLEEGTASLPAQNLIKRYLKSGQRQPFTHKGISEEARHMLVYDLINEHQYVLVQDFLERDI